MGIDANELNSALSLKWQRASLRSYTFPAWIKIQAESYLAVIRAALELHKKASGIRWLSDETVDDGIVIYVELMKIDYEYLPDHIEAYASILR